MYYKYKVNIFYQLLVWKKLIILFGSVRACVKNKKKKGEVKVALNTIKQTNQYLQQLGKCNKCSMIIIFIEFQNYIVKTKRFSNQN
jgi:hypothetical protein